MFAITLLGSECVGKGDALGAQVREVDKEGVRLKHALRLAGEPAELTG